MNEHVTFHLHWVAGQTRPQFFVDEVAVFNPATKETIAVAPLLKKRGNAQLVALPDDRLMLVGGRSYENSQAVVRPFSDAGEIREGLAAHQDKIARWR